LSIAIVVSIPASFVGSPVLWKCSTDAAIGQSSQGQ
jgi:hypothetical protein